MNIKDNKIADNAYDGIYIYDIINSNVNISNNNITGNVVEEGYYGIYISNADVNSKVDIDSNNISENSGSGIYSDSQVANVDVTSNNINNNGGQGIYLSFGGCGECGEPGSPGILNIKDNKITDNNYEGIYIYDIPNSNVNISKNNITGNGDGDEEGGGFSGLRIYSVDGNSQVDIDSNNISENNITGIFLEDQITNADITNNNVNNNGDLGLYFQQIADSSDMLTIRSNKISDNAYEGIYIAGITSSNVNISENNITGNGKYDGIEIYGIIIYSSDESSQVKIDSNNISENSGPGIKLDQGEGGATTNVDIINNYITNNNKDETVELRASIVILYALGNKAHSNRIIAEANNVALDNQDTENTFDAEKNYWGSASPDFASIISGNVSYTPWYLDEAMTTLADVQAAFNELTDDDIKKDNEDLDSVISNLNFITIGSRDTKIKWSSNSTAINALSGKVTRPSNNDEDKIVELKANISKANQTSLSKSFIATVLRETQTDEEAVSEALSEINIENILLSNEDKNNINTNLNLSTIASNGVALKWSSSDKSVIETTGSVSRTAADATIILKVTASKGTASESESFIVTVKGTADQDLIDLSNAKLALTDALVLNGNPSLDNVIAKLNLPASLSGHNVVISWSSDNSAVATNGTVTRSTTGDVKVKLTATFTKNLKTMTKQFLLTVKKEVAPVAVVDNTVTVDVGETEIVIDTTNIADLMAINVPSSVADDEIISLNLGTLRDDTGSLNLSTNDLTLSRNTSSGLDYKVVLPQGSVIKGSGSWNGVINLPTLKETSEVTPTAEAGVTKTVDVVIEVGFSQGQLNFTKAAKLTVPNQAGKSAGYTDAEDVFHTIPACTAAQIADPDTLGDGADCFTSSGADMLIWTKHFTKFAAFTSTATSSGSSGGDGTSGGTSGSSGGGSCAPGYKLEGKACVRAEEKPAEKAPEQVAEKAIPASEETPDEEEPLAAISQPTGQQGGLKGITGRAISAAAENPSMLAGIIVAILVLAALYSGYYYLYRKKQ